MIPGLGRTGRSWWNLVFDWYLPQLPYAAWHVSMFNCSKALTIQVRWVKTSRNHSSNHYLYRVYVTYVYHSQMGGLPFSNGRSMILFSPHDSSSFMSIHPKTKEQRPQWGVHTLLTWTHPSRFLSVSDARSNMSGMRCDDFKLHLNSY